MPLKFSTPKYHILLVRRARLFDYCRYNNHAPWSEHIHNITVKAMLAIIPLKKLKETAYQYDINLSMLVQSSYHGKEEMSKIQRKSIEEQHVDLSPVTTIVLAVYHLDFTQLYITTSTTKTSSTILSRSDVNNVHLQELTQISFPLGCNLYRTACLATLKIF